MSAVVTFNMTARLIAFFWIADSSLQSPALARRVSERTWLPIIHVYGSWNPTRLGGSGGVDTIRRSTTALSSQSRLCYRLLPSQANPTAKQKSQPPEIIAEAGKAVTFLGFATHWTICGLLTSRTLFQARKFAYVYEVQGEQ